MHMYCTQTMQNLGILKKEGPVNMKHLVHQVRIQCRQCQRRLSEKSVSAVDSCAVKGHMCVLGGRAWE